MIDLNHTLWQSCPWSNLRQINDSTIVGYKLVKGWGPERHIYFAATFSCKLENFQIYQDGQPVSYNTRRFRSHKEAWGEKLMACLTFAITAGEEIYVKTAISGVSTDGALKNIGELDGLSFDQIKHSAEQLWEKELGKYQIKGDRKTKETFYTSVYHTALHPFIFQDADGYYRGLDKNIEQAKGFTNYTTLSLWDTYRAFHLLLNLVNQDVNINVAHSMLAHYDKSVEEMLPIWSFYGNETWCMIGYHAVSVLADMIVKGVDGFDHKRAYEAMKTTAMNRHYDCLPEYTELGYVPFDKEAESVSKTLEYAYDDYCIAQAAKQLGKEDDYKYFSKRSLNYRNLIDPDTKYMRGRVPDVTVMNNSGQPGAALTIRIRGAGTNNSTDPLYVVDSFIMSNIESLNPGDIGSMEILKDAASAAIYGVQRANGVVLITTKKVKKEKAGLNIWEATVSKIRVVISICSMLRLMPV